MSLFGLQAESNNTIDVVDAVLLDEHNYVSELYKELVAGQRTIIESPGRPIIHMPVSMGKDSMTVLLGTTDAYIQAIEAGTIEKNRPLIITTVDTLVDAVPMRMFVRYCKARLERYAEAKGINLFFEIVVPPINDEYFIRWNGGQKLTPNPSRRGDCSILLKVDPSERFVRSLKAKFKNDPALEGYAKSSIITCVGSRTEEGNRRSGNMNRQGIRNKSYKKLLSEMESVKIGANVKLLKFAPIKNWIKDDVFTLLNMAGEHPVEKPVNGESIPAFLDNMALLIQIYGNGSNEACEISIGSNKQGTTCNGKSARFGCYICTMVGETDKSSTALAEYPRWASLGASDALRIRDYLYRLSIDMEARAFHARAYDPVTYNRLCLQPNVLKARHLEKITWYAAQLAVDSELRAKEFSKLVAEGREMEHDGYADIANDLLMTPKEKAAFLDMYKEQAQQPQYTCFSGKHAALLSFRWDIDGIGSLPYRPLAIWRDVNAGKRLPYPITNAEYAAKHGSLPKQGALPDALMLPILKDEDPIAFIDEGNDLLSYWVRPNSTMDVWEESMNCSVERETKKLPVTIAAKFSEQGNAVEVESVKCKGKLLPYRAIALLNEEFEDAALEHAQAVINSAYELAFKRGESKGWAQDTIEKALSGTVNVKVYLSNIVHQQLESGLNTKPSKVATKIQASVRKIKRDRHGMSRHNSSLSFYKPDTQSKLERQWASDNSLLSMNFDTASITAVPLHDNPLRHTAGLSDINNIDFNDQDFADWIHFGGLDSALEVHDNLIRMRIKNRHITGYKRVRGYTNNDVAETMLRSAGIVISKTYYTQLTAILRRTQLFAEIGAFEFQNYRHEQLVAFDRVIPMAQHRADKITVLKEIRRRRNAGRNRVKAMLAQDSATAIDTLTNNANAFKAQCSLAIKSVQHGIADALGGIFYDDPISLSQRAKTARLWFGVNWETVTNSENFTKALVGQTLSGVVFSVDQFKAAELWQDNANLALQQIEQALEMWQPVEETMEDITHNLASGNIDLKEFHQQWHNMVETHQHLREIFTFYNNNWTPGENYAGKLSQERLERVKVNLGLLRELKDELQQEYQSAKRKAARNMSLSQRLAMMQRVAA